MTVRLGIIGAGAIGKQHAQAAQRCGVAVTAVCDLNDIAAKAMAAEFKIDLVTKDPAEVFNSKQVDAVVIGVPNRFHAEQTLAAIKAGKDVLLEKPMAMNQKECAQVNAAAKDAGRIVQIGHMHRFDPVSRTAKQFIEAGRLGTIYHAKANYYRRRGVPGLGGWFTTKEVSGGGPLIDIGVHVLDLTMHLLSYRKPVRVSGKVFANFGKRMKDYVYEGMWAGPPKLTGVCDVEDAAHAIVRFEDGSTLELNCTWAMNFVDGTLPSLIGIFGDQAGLTFGLGGSELRIAGELEGHNVDLQPKLKPGNSRDDQLKTFLQAIADRKPTGIEATGEQGQVIMSIIDAIYESSKQDREVAI